MSSGLLFWSASAVGAVLFFVSGYLFAPKRRSETAGDRSRHDTGPSPREQELLAQVAERDARIQALGEQSREAAGRLASSEGERERLRAEVAAAGRALRERDEARAQAERAVREAAGAERQVQEARKQAEDARRQGEDARRQIEEARRQAEEARRQADDAREKLAGTSRTAAEAEKKAEIALRALAKAQSQLATAEADRAARSREVESLREHTVKTVPGIQESAAFREELIRASTEVKRLRMELDAAKVALDAATHKIADRDVELAALRPLERSHTELVMRAEALKASSAEAERLRQERSDLTTHLKEIERDLGARPDQKLVDELRYDLGIQRQLATARQEVLERTQDENARLRAATEDTDILRRRLGELTHEVESLRAAGYLARSAHDKRPAKGNEGPPISTQALVEKLGTSPNVRTAVVSDEMGFVVASHGELADTLGAFGTFLADAASRATAILPVGEVKEVRIRGEHDVTIAAHRAPSRLILSMIEIAPEKQEDRDVREQLRRTPLRPGA